MRRLMVMAAAGVMACWTACAARVARAAQPPSQQGIDFFETKIRPVLIHRCYECHSQARKKIKGKLRLDNYASMLKGGESGQPTVVPGKPDKSLMIMAMTYTDQDTPTHDALLMPPPKNGKPRKLPDSVINDFRQWIKMGAPYPRGGAARSTVPVPNAAQTHWAFVPPADPAIPSVQQTAWIKDPIDNFVLAKLEGNHLHPSHPADKRTLIRRATFDLIGLPPTEDEVEAFEADDSANAFEKVVDRLLASPRYGERWGRFWLDVARYADTKGYVFEEERRYPYSYTYRDWVIGAFNDDLPYNQFLIDQIAADKLNLKGDDKALAAEGFLTLGRRFLNHLPDIIDDRIDVVCRGTMALTVGCARCHDHKFDPISQKDYYSLYSVFNNSPEATNLPLIGNPKDTPGYAHFATELAAKEAQVESYRQGKLAEHVAALRSAGQITDDLLAAHFRGTPAEQQYLKVPGVTPWIAARWGSFLDQKAGAKDPVFAAWRAYAAVPANGFAAKSASVTKELSGQTESINPLVLAAFANAAPSSLRDVAERYGKLLASADHPSACPDAPREALRQVLRADDSPTNVRMDEIARVLSVPEAQHARKLARDVEGYKATAPGAPPRAMVLTDAPSDAPQHVFLRGNPGNPGPLVKPAFLALLGGKPFTQGSGRLQLAHDIATKDNPLTARVIVNRVWLHHFGKGLVRTPSDFGMRSDPPTHPKLLDYLAVRFVENGWSIKKLHKMIMLSAAYQQSSEDDPAVAKSDPDNMFLSHFNRRRLDWEATRDSILFAAGKLDTKMGGRPVDAFKSHRRTVYAFIDRQNLPGVFRAFDFATPDATSPQRFTTTVPQQALFLMNSPFVVNQARSLAGRPEVVRQPDAVQRIAQLYRIVYQRSPDPGEIALGVQFVGGEKGSARLTNWDQYAQALLESNEFVFVD